MQSANLPARTPKAWGANADPTVIRPIPDASQIGVHDGFASWPDGFPPLTKQAPEAGGVPPDIRDVNGVLNALSLWVQWLQLGAPVRFDAALSTALGGYPKGAVVQSSALNGVFWRSTADNNGTDPDGATPANWANFFAPALSAAAADASTKDAAVAATAHSDAVGLANAAQTAAYNAALGWVGANMQALVAGVIAAVATAAGFVAGFGGTNTAYIKFPSWLGGFIIQFQGGVVSPGVISFPIAFPNACFGALGIPNTPDTTTYGLNIANNTTTGTTVYPNNGGGGATILITVISFGH